MITSNGTGGGDFNSSSTWVGEVVPTSGVDMFTIASGDQVYLNQNYACPEDASEICTNLGTISGTGSDVVLSGPFDNQGTFALNANFTASGPWSGTLPTPLTGVSSYDCTVITEDTVHLYSNSNETVAPAHNFNNLIDSDMAIVLHAIDSSSGSGLPGTFSGNLICESLTGDTQYFTGVFQDLDGNVIMNGSSLSSYVLSPDLTLTMSGGTITEVVHKGGTLAWTGGTISELVLTTMISTLSTPSGVIDISTLYRTPSFVVGGIS